MPASPALELSHDQVSETAQFQDIFARAQALKQQRQMFPLQLAKASQDLALSDLEQQDKRNVLSLYKKKVDSGAIDAEIAASASSAHLTNATNDLALGALTDMGVSASDQPATVATPATAGQPAVPAKPAAQSQFKQSLQSLINYQKANPDDILGFDVQKKAFDAQYGYARSIHPAVGLAIDKALAPIMAEQTRRVAGAQAHANLWASANVAKVASMGSADEFNTWLGAGNANSHAMAMLFDQKYSEAVLKNTEKWQQQKFDLDKIGATAEQAVKTKLAESLPARTVELPGYTFVSRTPEQAQKFIEAHTDYTQLTNKLNSLLKLTNDSTFMDKLLPTERAAKLGQLNSVIGAEIAKMKFSRTTQTEWEGMKHDVVGDVSKFTVVPGQVRARIETLLASGKSDLDVLAQNAGGPIAADPGAGGFSHAPAASITPEQAREILRKRRETKNTAPDPNAATNEQLLKDMDGRDG